MDDFEKLLADDGDKIDDFIKRLTEDDLNSIPDPGVITLHYKLKERRDVIITKYKDIEMMKYTIAGRVKEVFNESSTEGFVYLVKHEDFIYVGTDVHDGVEMAVSEFTLVWGGHEDENGNVEEAFEVVADGEDHHIHIYEYESFEEAYKAAWELRIGHPLCYKKRK